jgi:hypothetical protein
VNIVLVQLKKETHGRYQDQEYHKQYEEICPTLASVPIVMNQEIGIKIKYADPECI